MQVFHSSARFLHQSNNVTDGYSRSLVSIFYAALRQVLHTNDWYSRDFVRRIHLDYIGMLGCHHRLSLRVDIGARGEPEWIQILGGALTS
ncbi:hypothetical protein [Cryobacterium sp. TMT1-2-1]|uniref:hypothetical protein n=1 Tax=Cryobacterium sp. TMT1-2-1 TaxID=1259232 RepID=UPI001F5462AE|nr:hypothetical protein [Cryobacterium sp. TMT1-2-1]